ncbi:MAG: 30S ribosomal protein S9 [Candidatus Pacebacteria bacterium]|nr:30S ribosomal protein S9 [Candidatus Paceibacterota bacterium]MBP9840517.1 30S ribosomal protein S9 [Candidatus Paceibacterota bacterium]
MPDKTPYVAAIGRRKTAVARVRLMKAKEASVTVNGMPAKDYFHTDERTLISEESLKAAELDGIYAVTAKVAGGGIAAQADAVRMGIARAATMVNPNTRGTLKSAGFLKRDPRAKERKKPGLVKARKRKQWSKR